MSLKSAIDRLVAPALAEVGFVFDRMPDSASWRFSRTQGEVKHYITFVQSRQRVNAIRVDFATSQDPVGIDAGALNPGVEPRSWWTYSDHQTLEAALQELLIITLRQGLEWFIVSGRAPLSVPIPIAKQVLDRPDLKAEIVAARLGLSQYAEPTDALNRLEDALLLARNASVNGVDWEFIVAAAAFVGELIRCRFGGQWEWDSALQTPALVEVAGRHGVGARPLSIVCNFWGKPDIRFALTTAYDFCRKMYS